MMVPVVNPSDHPLQVILYSINPPDEFLLPSDSEQPYFLPPRSSSAIGPIYFLPQYFHQTNMSLYLKNNLTVLEMISIHGQGGSGLFVFTSTNVTKSQRILLDSLTFHLNSTHMEQCLDKNNPQLTITKEFLGMNQGNLPVQVYGLSINYGSCRDYGFRVSPCGPFTLQPNEEILISITFSPDFSSSIVKRSLIVSTSQGDISFPLEAELPYDWLSICADSQPLSSFQQTLKLFFILFSIIIFLIFCIYFTNEIFKKKSKKNKNHWLLDDKKNPSLSCHNNENVNTLRDHANISPLQIGGGIFVDSKDHHDFLSTNINSNSIPIFNQLKKLEFPDENHFSSEIDDFVSSLPIKSPKKPKNKKQQLKKKQKDVDDPAKNNNNEINESNTNDKNLQRNENNLSKSPPSVIIQSNTIKEENNSMDTEKVIINQNVNVKNVNENQKEIKKQQQEKEIIKTTTTTTSTIRNENLTCQPVVSSESFILPKAGDIVIPIHTKQEIKSSKVEENEKEENQKIDQSKKPKELKRNDKNIKLNQSFDSSSNNLQNSNTEKQNKTSKPSKNIKDYDFSNLSNSSNRNRSSSLKDNDHHHNHKSKSSPVSPVPRKHNDNRKSINSNRDRSSRKINKKEKVWEPKKILSRPKTNQFPSNSHQDCCDEKKTIEFDIEAIISDDDSNNLQISPPTSLRNKQHGSSSSFSVSRTSWDSSPLGVAMLRSDCDSMVDENDLQDFSGNPGVIGQITPPRGSSVNHGASSNSRNTLDTIFSRNPSIFSQSDSLFAPSQGSSQNRSFSDDPDLPDRLDDSKDKFSSVYQLF